ncbi:MAG: hypothetical protein JF564_03520 [Sphingomonas sp.]|nr:hypothetical protein [Sphingomonas sp.]
MRSIIAAIVTMIVLFSSTVAHASTKQCLAKRRAAGFSGKEWLCNKTSTFRFVGRISRSGYEIYDYRYRFLPHAGGAMHGGQRIKIFRGGKYIGEYPLSPPPVVNIAVRGARLILSTDDADRKVELNLSKGLPARILVNGEVEDFAR